MEKIEVELTPVRIVEKATAVAVQSPQNEVKVTVLKFKVVIPKIEQLEDGVEHIIPRSVDLKIPDEYVGYMEFPLNGGEPLSETYPVQLNLPPDQLKPHLLEQDYEQEFVLTITSNFDNVVANVVTHIVQTQNKYGVAKFSNVPQLYINQSGKLAVEMDQVGSDSDIASQASYLIDQIQIHYKGEQFAPSFLSWDQQQLGYKVGFEVEHFDGSVVESQVGNRLSYWETRNFTVDYNNLPRSIRVLFKHDDHKFTVELWNSTMQP